jgi:hypothetical protein
MLGVLSIFGGEVSFVEFCIGFWEKEVRELLYRSTDVTRVNGLAGRSQS